MFLFILESVGTQELLLIGLAALIFLGPRRMPEMAKKVGKFMAEFRGTANEFKETWRREVDIENAARGFDLNNIEAEVSAEKTVAQEAQTPPAVAEIKEVSPEQLEQLKLAAEKTAENEAKAAAAANDKKNWL